MFKLIVFDFDGTLVDSKEVSIKIYNQLAEKYNTRNIENLDSLRGLSLIDRFKVLNIPFYKLPLFAADFTKQYKHSIKTLSIVSGMTEVLLELKRRGYEMAIVSSNSESNIRDFLRKNNLNIIKTVISSTNVLGKDKDIQKLLALHKLNPSEVVYIGDEIRDIKACKKVGLKIIWVNWGYDVLDKYYEDQPDYFAGSPQEILSFLS